VFAQLPSAAKTVEDRALASALAALPDVARDSAGRCGRALARPPRRWVCLASPPVRSLRRVRSTSGSAGPTRSRGSTRSSPRLVVPPRARAIAAVVDGALLTSRGGLRIEGLPVESATLSPHAL